MAIDFSVEPEFQDKLHWMDEFVTQEIEPIDLYFRGEVNPFDRTNDTANALIRPLQQQVIGRGLWACHLGPHLGGLGYQPLLDAKISSTYAMTKPQGGSDPNEFTCRDHRDGDEWVINGRSGSPPTSSTPSPSRSSRAASPPTASSPPSTSPPRPRI